ncbi:MAG TPA: metalloregulator ArsR/SmtB family transcription factor [Solirubrobacterales bacterium]
MSRLTPESSELVAKRFAALADPTRLRLLDLMHARGEAAVGELAEGVGATYANVSKHLSVLLAQRMVTRRREGSRALYSIADPALVRICDEVCAGIRDQLDALAALIDEAATVTEP